MSHATRVPAAPGASPAIPAELAVRIAQRMPVLAGQLEQLVDVIAEFEREQDQLCRELADAIGENQGLFDAALDSMFGAWTTTATVIVDGLRGEGWPDAGTATTTRTPAEILATLNVAKAALDEIRSQFDAVGGVR